MKIILAACGAAGIMGAPLLAQVEIGTLAELHAVRQNLTGSYRLTNDIDAAATADWNALIDRGAWSAATDYVRVDPLSHDRVQHLTTNYYALADSGPGHGGAVEPGVAANWATYWQVTTLPAGHKLGFEPIGPSASVTFRGVLDGNGYAITNLAIDRPETLNYVGLFGYAKNSGTAIRDLTLSGSVVGKNSVGLLCGFLIYQALCSNVVIHADVRGESTVAALIGNADGALVFGCRIYGRVAGTQRVGGANGYTHQNSRFEDNLSAATVVRLASSTETAFGSFVGYSRNSKFRRNYALGPVHYEGAADPQNRGFCGTKAGVLPASVDENNFFDMETTGQSSSGGNATGKTTAEMRDIATYTDLRTLGLGRVLAGTASADASGTTVTGAGTAFATALLPGDWVRLGNGIEHAAIREVASITDDTTLIVTQPFDRAFAAVPIYNVAATDRWDMQASREDPSDGYPWLSEKAPPLWKIYVYTPPKGSLILIH